MIFWCWNLRGFLTLINFCRPISAILGSPSFLSIDLNCVRTPVIFSTQFSMSILPTVLTYPSTAITFPDQFDLSLDPHYCVRTHFPSILTCLKSLIIFVDHLTCPRTPIIFCGSSLRSRSKPQLASVRLRSHRGGDCRPCPSNPSFSVCHLSSFSVDQRIVVKPVWPKIGLVVLDIVINKILADS